MTIIEYGQIIDGELWQLITEGDDLAVLRSTG
jgi:hypothetical protein